MLREQFRARGLAEAVAAVHEARTVFRRDRLRDSALTIDLYAPETRQDVRDLPMNEVRAIGLRRDVHGQA